MDVLSKRQKYWKENWTGRWDSYNSQPSARVADALPLAPHPLNEESTRESEDNEVVEECEKGLRIAAAKVSEGPNHPGPFLISFRPFSFRHGCTRNSQSCNRTGCFVFETLRQITCPRGVLFSKRANKNRETHV